MAKRQSSSNSLGIGALVRTLSSSSILSSKLQGMEVKPEEEKGMDDGSPQAMEEQESNPDESLLQLSSNTYIVLDSEGSVKVEVMRMGNTSVRSKVHYRTCPGTAKEGVQYTHTEGVLEFEEGDIEKALYVPVKQLRTWTLGAEFSVRLLQDPAPENAALSLYLHEARVKILDASAFPAEGFARVVGADQETAQSQSRFQWLLLAYIRWNWRHSPHIRMGTLKMLLVAMLDNLYVLLTLCIKLLLVDMVLVPGKVDSPLKHLVLFAGLWIVPFGILHLLEARQLQWKVSGMSRAVLQQALLTKFLNYEEERREDVQSGDLVMAMTRDVEHLVAGGYMQMVRLWQSAGNLFALLVYQIISPTISGGEFSEMQWFPMKLTVLFPLLLATFLVLRVRITTRYVNSMDAMQDAMASQVGRIYANYRMIADYSRRLFFEGRFLARIQDYNRARTQATLVLNNNKRFPKWISVLSFAAYMIWGGLQVVRTDVPPEERLSLGLFVTTLDLLDTMGTAWQSIYTILLEMQGSFPALTMVVRLLNRPTNVVRRMQAGRRMREETKRQRCKLRQTVSSLPQDTKARFNLRVDMMHIKVANLTVDYSSSVLNSSKKASFHLPGELRVNQGELVCLVGPIGEGKSTLLKVLGGILFSTTGTTFVPAHLRLLHVSQEPTFYTGSLYENLIFGCAPDHPDAAVDRVAQVCRRLGIPEELVAKVAEGKDGPVLLWREVLSQTYKCLFHIARALVANPEVLILHKPMVGLYDTTSIQLMQILREFCDQRGIEQDSGKVHLRRPRTCIFTCTRTVGLRAADRNFLISADTGICELGGQERQHLQGKMASTLTPDAFDELKEIRKPLTESSDKPDKTVPDSLHL